MSSAEEILGEIRKIREQDNERIREIGIDAYIRETNEIAQAAMERVGQRTEEDRKSPEQAEV